MDDFWKVLQGPTGGVGAFFALLSGLLYRGQLVPKPMHEQICQQWKERWEEESENSKKWERLCMELLQQPKMAAEVVKEAVKVAEVAVAK